MLLLCSSLSAQNPHVSVRVVHISIACYCAILGNRAVGAGDGVIAGVVVPIRTKGDRFSSRDRTAELNARQTAATGERRTSNARHDIENDNVRQTVAIEERPIPDARHAIGNDNVRQTAATVERILTNVRYT
jgi:hypothetical protein